MDYPCESLNKGHPLIRATSQESNPEPFIEYKDLGGGCYWTHVINALKGYLCESLHKGCP